MRCGLPARWLVTIRPGCCWCTWSSRRCTTGNWVWRFPFPPTFTRACIERLSRLVPVECGIRVETILVEGNASQQILRIAEEHHCDLIILGTHGRTGLSRVLLGSVAEDVIRHSRFPVLTLKTPTLLEPAASESTEACAVVARQAEEKPSRSVLVI